MLNLFDSSSNGKCLRGGELWLFKICSINSLQIKIIVYEQAIGHTIVCTNCQNCKLSLIQNHKLVFTQMWKCDHVIDELLVINHIPVWRGTETRMRFAANLPLTQHRFWVNPSHSCHILQFYTFSKKISCLANEHGAIKWWYIQGPITSADQSKT